MRTLARDLDTQPPLAFTFPFGCQLSGLQLDASDIIRRWAREGTGKVSIASSRISSFLFVLEKCRLFFKDTSMEISFAKLSSFASHSQFQNWILADTTFKTVMLAAKATSLLDSSFFFFFQIQNVNTGLSWRGQILSLIQTCRHQMCLLELPEVELPKIYKHILVSFATLHVILLV